MKKVRITQMKGTVRVLPEHRANLAALGLRGIRKTKEHVLTLLFKG
jgi:large subunit ribosomal protein L30